MFGIRKCADGFNKRHVSCFKPSAEIEKSFIICTAVEIERCKVSVADVQDLMSDGEYIAKGRE